MRWHRKRDVGNIPFAVILEREARERSTKKEDKQEEKGLASKVVQFASKCFC